MCTTCKYMNLYGRVLKRDGSAVTQPQTIGFRHEAGALYGPLTTGSNGSYSVCLPLPGEWTVKVNGCPAIPSSIDRDTPFGWCRKAFRRTCDEQGNPETLNPSGWVDGCVVREDGEPVPGPQEVTFEQDGQPVYTFWTEPDGGFSVLVPDGAYDVRVNGARCKGPSSIRVTAGADLTEEFQALSVLEYRAETIRDGGTTA